MRSFGRTIIWQNDSQDRSGPAFNHFALQSFCQLLLQQVVMRGSRARGADNMFRSVDAGSADAMETLTTSQTWMRNGYWLR